MNGTPNPECACGCGVEVARPWNKYVIGHTKGRKLAYAQMRILRKLLASGVSQRRVAEILGVSQGWVSQLSWNPFYANRFRQAGKAVVRREEIEQWSNYRLMKRSLGALKRQLKSLDSAGRAKSS